MNRFLHYRTLLGSLILISSVACNVSEPDPACSYHFDAPASKWEESFPLGNGRMGVMPDGGTDRETIILNEISMWSGSRQNTDNPLAVESLPEIRNLLFQGRNDEAQNLMYKTFTCAGTGSYSGHSHSQPYGSYQLFGRMHLDFGHTDFSGYRRELSLDEAMASVQYTSNGVNYRRETIVSYQDDVIAIHLTSDRKDALEFALSLDRISADKKPSPAVDITVDGEDLVMSGRLPSGTENGGPADGPRYIGRVRILLPHGGRLQAEDSTLKVTGAQEATVLVALKTDYFQDDYQKIAKDLLDKASGLSWEKLLRRHKESFSALFNRVSLDFGHDAAREALPMDKRLEAFAENPQDPSLVALYYQFGRYLLISSTRPGYLPPNLQGLWANTIDTPWNGDYHLNINLQMNLWPAESGNLGELHMPLIEWVKKQVPSGQNTARVFYNSRGWVAHVLGNVWEFTAPAESPTWGATNTSAAWLCQHLYRHYQYNPDEEYLREVYPVMKEAALFFVDMLVEDPNSHYLVTAPTTSPENGYKFANGTRRATICAGSTMDNQIIRELFNNTMEASAILNIDSGFRDTLATTRDRLMPTTIAEDGRIMEWLEPFEEVEIGHRHVSHLFGLYPGDEISIARTPELAAAARRSLEVRGDQSTGWSMAWKINFWARLHDGDHAYKLITDLLNPASHGMDYRNGGGSYPNLFCAHPPFQIDGNFGGAAGIAEMLVQSHEGQIELLPALPSSLPDGSLSGIRVRGGAEISMSWKDGRVTSVSLHALHDGAFDIKNFSDGPVNLKEGETWKWEQPAATASGYGLTKAERKAGEQEAAAVIDRFTGGSMKVKVQLSLEKDSEGRDSYAYEVKGNTLHIKASSAVAACRGFYDYVKSKGAGICSWSGNRFSLPADMAAEAVSVTSPYRDHQYFNVVTYGYSMPFWDEERWDRELDWMALHGIDMPLLLIGQEQVYREVFKDMGLTDEEIDIWETGPAHLPWMRMGNLSGNSFDGPLGKDWNERQTALCKHVIERMRRLGMKPICPAFGGFVPKNFVKHYEGSIDLTGWDWVPEDTRNYRLNPGSAAFVDVGTRFIRKWEEKFGKCQYYLSDSFNEMEIPQDKALMTSYGDAIYKSIHDADPDAVWVMQGWTVGFQRSHWGNGILEALVRNVPDDKFLMLDMATDYNRIWWKSSYNWEYYDGFYGKPWVWSVIPNMGGKTAFTGVIDYYANGRLDAWNSAKRGRMTGYGIAAEGIENNEMLYELLSDGGWTGARDSIDVTAWLEQYSRCRYGMEDGQDSAFHDALRTSVYAGFRDHPQFAWQVRRNITGRGNVQVNEKYYDAVETLFADPAALETRIEESGSLYRADLIEAAAMYVSGKVEDINSRIRQAVDAGDKQQAHEVLTGLEDIMLRLDRSLTAHPLYNLELWESQAMKMAAGESDRKRNAVNARRIVSVWYGNHSGDEPVNDYACRIWAGLVRDYYLPRMVGSWLQLIDGTPFDLNAFENSFVEKAPELSAQQPLAAEDVVGFLAALISDTRILADETRQ